MNDFSRVFYLNGRQLLYTKRSLDNSGRNIEKKLTEIPQGKDFVAKVPCFPVVTVKSTNNGQSFSYSNKLTFRSMDAIKNSTGAYTVTVPTKKGGQNVGYIKDGNAIPWTRNKSNVRLMRKIANMIKKGI